MVLLMAEQLRCIYDVPEGERVVYFDATGGLVKNPDRYAKPFGDSFKRMLNYFLVLRHSKASTMVAELVSSDHKTERLTSFFMSLAFKFRAMFKRDLKFRLVVLDYSWASIHAVLDGLNRETVLSYAARAFALAKNETTIESGMTWLASCAPSSAGPMSPRRPSRSFAILSVCF